MAIPSKIHKYNSRPTTRTRQRHKINNKVRMKQKIKEPQHNN